MANLNVLFVGSFAHLNNSNHTGGQMFASQSLIESRLSGKINWKLIDSTADSNLKESILKRGKRAAKRLLIFIKLLVFSKVDVCLIFTADGFSFVEKGVMVFMARLLRKKVMLAPRSGIVVNDIANSSFMRFYIPLVLRFADIIVCQGYSWILFYSKMLNKKKDKCVEIQNWLDVEPYQTMKKTKNLEVVNVLFLSWVDENKGIYDLIKAAKMVIMKNSKVCFHIAGDGMAMQQSTELVQELDLSINFKFYSWVNKKEKLDLFKICDIYVLPSYFEGFPNSLMEAMAAKCAVISTKVGSVPDLVEHRDNGLLYDPGDVNTLAQYINLLVDNIDLRQSIAQNAQKTVFENNSIDVAVSKFEYLFGV